MTEADGERLPARERWRREQRASRRSEFLEAARTIVTTDGQAALTMLNLAKVVGTSEGNVYNYFASKAVLLAELEIEALEVLAEAFSQGQSNLQHHLDQAQTAPPLATLTRSLAGTRFLMAAENTLPNEVELSRRIYSQPGMLEGKDATRVIGAGLSFVNLGVEALDAAVAAEVLDPGNNLERAVLAVACVAGALITSRLDQWDSGLFDGRRMAGELAGYLYLGWGAAPELLADATAILESMTDEQLAPTVTR